MRKTIFIFSSVIFSSCEFATDKGSFDRFKTLQIRNLKILFLFLIFPMFSAQNFPYDQVWGTYIGGGGTQIFEDNRFGNPFFVDPQDNIFLHANVLPTNNAYPASYYSQFAVSTGGYPFVNNASVNYFLTGFSSSGIQLYGAYNGQENGDCERLLAIDAQGNRYVAKIQSGFISGLATPGAWLSYYTDTIVGNGIVKTYTFSKYDSSGNLIYTTYLPNTSGVKCYVQGDSAVLVGLTSQELTEISSPGVFQEHYVDYSIGQQNYENGYYVKLSSTGDREIGSYLPGYITGKYYNGGLYFFTSVSGLPASVQQSFVTPGTFQQSGGRQVLCKFNADTATLVWGTRIGTDPSGVLTEVYSFNVNETGIYLYGMADSVVGGYYATAGAFKTQITGDNDLFLTKFNDTGNRVWGTYLGGNGWDDNQNSYVFALKGNRIVVGGNTYGTDNLSTPGAYLTTPSNPSNVGNAFFAGFDTDGNRNFCSYYGGVSTGSVFGEEISTSFDNAGSLYLWGHTIRTVGIATPNGAYPNAINPQGFPFGYVTKFSPKESELAVSETEDIRDLVLYDNPNNGDFTLSGSILEKQNCKIKIYDSAGRLLANPPFQKTKIQKYTMKSLLSNGIYFVHIISEKGKTLKVFKMAVQ